jgi:hypothetical protein
MRALFLILVKQYCLCWYADDHHRMSSQFLNECDLTSTEIGVERRISGNTYLQAFWAKNLINRFESLNMHLHVDFSQLAVCSSSNGTHVLSAGSGGMLRDGKSEYRTLSRQPGVGRGAVVFTTFLDLNANGKREVAETKIAGLKFWLQAGIRETVERIPLLSFAVWRYIIPIQ